jgi:hypothetical protein
MTDEKLTIYFGQAQLPQTLRLDRATTQNDTPQAVNINMEKMKADLKDHRCRHRLKRIADAMKHPNAGPEIPRF